MIAELYKASTSADGRCLFAGLSFTSCPGDRVALIANDPVAASSAVEAMLGMRGLSEGWASFDGEPVLPHQAAYFRRFVSYLPPRLNFGNVTVGEVARGMYGEDVNSGCKYSVDTVLDCLHRLGVEADSLDKPFASLDKGEAQRAAMALSLMFKRPVVLLDNPTSAQDDDGRRLVAALLASERFDDVSVVVATNDEEIIAVCNKKILI